MKQKHLASTKSSN